MEFSKNSIEVCGKKYKFKRCTNAQILEHQKSIEAEQEKYKPIREAKKAKQKAELDATSAKYTRSQYYDMRLFTRTEADMPEGMLGFDADEVVRKANAAKDEKEAVAI